MQLNYFGISTDHAIIASQILAVLRPVGVIPERGSRSEMTVRELRCEEELLPERLPNKVCLVLLDLLRCDCESVQQKATLVSAPGNKWWFDATCNPAIEFAPATETSEGMVRVGRLWSPHSADTAVGQRASKLFRRLRDRSKPDLADDRFRLFPLAAAQAKMLDFGLGIIRPPSLRAAD